MPDQIIFTQKDLWLAISETKKKNKAKAADIVDHVKSTSGISLPTDLVRREELAFQRKYANVYKRTKTLELIAKEDTDDKEDILDPLWNQNQNKEKNQTENHTEVEENDESHEELETKKPRKLFQQCSGEPLEANNKNIRKYLNNFSRKTDPVLQLMDVMNRNLD